ncbi:hypothetical protein NST28_29215 [Paenibacillus sp. FSL R10-2791]|uniref:hypothetical protein n=1 Tax=Paenibacillus sp. FSL R10-2791 TaxID=2954695 RepID=UPI0030F8DD4F
MTPERIEPIKLAAFTREELIKLIRKQEAALEESQQQRDEFWSMVKVHGEEKRKAETELFELRNDVAEAIRDKDRTLAESQQQLADSLERERGLKHLCNQSLEEKERANRELAEAQQTIARQQKVIEWYESGGSMGELVEEGSDKA